MKKGGINLKNTIEYKGYIGSVEFSENDGLFFGKVQGIRSLISYEGATASELVEDFHGAVDDYLALCEEEGEQHDQHDDDGCQNADDESHYPLRDAECLVREQGDRVRLNCAADAERGQGS